MRRGESWNRVFFLGCALAVFAGPVVAQEGRVLLIGSSGATTEKAARRKEEASQPTLQRFIQEETGLENKVRHQKDWRDLSNQLVKGQQHLGVFEGYEFAWAQEKHPGLKPLAVAVNVHRYPIACVMVKHDSKSKDFSALRGKSIYLSAAGPHHLRLFVSRRSQAAGKTLETFFSKITTQDTIEDALDDVVDGVIGAAVVDRAALEAYRARKPGRAKRLRELLRSPPFPPPVVAYHGNGLDEATRLRFRQGLLGASRKAKGRTLLTLFRTTAFEAVPDSFDKLLARTRKDYPEKLDPTK